MIPIWVFVIACIIFIGAIIHAYWRNNILRFENKEIAHVLKCYIDKYGKLDWSTIERNFGE